MVLRIAICDDETTEIQKLKGYIDDILSKYPYYRVIRDVYRSGKDLIDYHGRVSKHEYYDIIFLDKDLGDTDGIETAHKLREFDMRFQLVYVTKFPQYICDASETDMFRYLVKPVPQNKFNQIFDFAIRKIDAREKVFYYTSGYNKLRVFAREIMYFERFEPGLTTYMYTADGETHTMSARLGVILKELEDFGFICPHSTYIVNLAYVGAVQRDWLFLDNKTKISISRPRSPKVKSQFLEYKFRSSDV